MERGKNIEDWTWDDPIEAMTAPKDKVESEFSGDNFLETLSEEDLEKFENPDSGHEDIEAEPDPIEASDTASDEGGEEPAVEYAEESEEDDEAGIPEVDEVKLFKTISEDLKTKGYDLGFGDDDEPTEEVFFERFAEFADNAVKGSIDAWKESLPGEAKDYIRFVSNGGSPDEYYKAVGAGSWRSYDINSDSGSEQMVRYYLKEVEGLPDDEVDEEVEALKDIDRVDKKAEFFKARLEKASDAQVKARADELERLNKQREQAERGRIESLKSTAKELKEYKGYPIDTKKAYDALTRNTVKVGDTYVPSFAAKFQKIWVEEPDKLLLLAQLVESDFDFSSIERKVETKVTRKTKDLIKKGKEQQKSRVSQVKNKPVWEVGNF